MRAADASTRAADAATQRPPMLMSPTGGISTTALKNETASSLHGFMGPPKAGLFEKNVAKPYEHAYRDDACDRVHRMDTTQLSPNRLHGKHLLADLAAAQRRAERAAEVKLAAEAKVAKAGGMIRASDGGQGGGGGGDGESASSVVSGMVYVPAAKPQRWSSTLVPTNKATSQRANIPHCQSRPSYEDQKTVRCVLDVCVSPACVPLTSTLSTPLALPAFKGLHGGREGRGR
jgi:hypothetical protein